MLNENLEDLSCKSKEYYKSIAALKIKPVEILDMSKYLIHRKGDVIIKKRLFRKPIKKTVDEDVYRYLGETHNAKRLAYYLGVRYNKSTNTFYSPGVAYIYDTNKKLETMKFDTNEDLKMFITDLKEKCKKCGNELL